MSTFKSPIKLTHCYLQIDSLEFHILVLLPALSHQW